MGSLFEELVARETVAGARVEELEARIAEFTGVLAAEWERLSRLAITRETLVELAAEIPESPVLPERREFPEMPPGGPVSAVTRSVPSPMELSSGARVVGVLTMPHREPGMSIGVLPSDYRDIVEVVSDAPGPIRAKQVVPRAGLAVSAGKIEGTRSKLKRLVERGWLAEEVPGAAGDQRSLPQRRPHTPRPPADDPDPPWQPEATTRREAPA